MQEVFEKIKEKIQREIEDLIVQDTYSKGKNAGLRKAGIFVDEVAAEYNNGWIPFTQRKLTEEEKEEIGTEYDYMLDCKLPEEDEEILVTYANGTVGEDIFMCNGTDCYLDSGNDFITEAIAWRHKPDPYHPKGE